MRPLLILALLLSGVSSAFAFNVNVLVTYTPGASTAAGGDSALETQVGTALAVANGNYAASGINITLVPYYRPAGPSVPNSAATMQQQYAWARDSAASLGLRASSLVNADLQVHISNPASEGSVIGGVATDAKTAQAAIAYADLAIDVEYAISKMMGANSGGYAIRSRTYNTDPIYGGNPICVRSRDAAPFPTSVYTVVPFPTGYRATQWVNGPGYFDAATQQAACNAGISAAGATSASVGPGGTTCVYAFSGGSRATALNSIPTQTPDAVSCTETLSGRYSDANYTYPGTNLKLGDGTHNSVSTLNGRESIITGLRSANWKAYGLLKGGFNLWFRNWIGGIGGS
jgi:hypothetical protein